MNMVWGGAAPKLKRISERDEARKPDVYYFLCKIVEPVLEKYKSSQSDAVRTPSPQEPGR